MNRYKKIALSFLLAAPVVVNASGMGVYIPIGVANSSSVTGDYYDDTNDREYEQDFGFGVTYDSNIGKDKLYNYRLGVEYVNAAVDTHNGYTSDQEFGRFNVVNTMGFGVVRNKNIRLWIGPRLNVALNWSSEDNGYYESAFEFGIAPAAGINLNLSRTVALGFDVDYRFAFVAGAWSNNTNDDTYTGSMTGPTARFYLLFKFGEEFQKEAASISDDTIIDQNI